MALSLRLLFASSAATWLAFTAGLAFGYSSAAAFQIFLSIEWSSIFASSLNLGGLIGSLLTGYLLSKHGRRSAMLYACLPGLIGWLWLRLSADTVYERYAPTFMFMAGRILTGISAGMAIPSSATYLVEIAPPEYYSLFGTLPQIGIVMGITVAYLLGAFFPWETVALMDTVIMLITTLFVFVVPESPKWLLKSNDVIKANTANSWLHSGSDALPETADLKLTEEGLSNDAVSTRLIDHIFPFGAIPVSQRPRLRVVLLLMILQQLTGINAILYFAESVCMFGGFAWPAICAILLGLAQFLFTVIGACFIHRFSRKCMLQSSALIMCAAHLVHGIILLAAPPFSTLNSLGKLCVVIYLMGFSIGWGPLPILVTMDLFPIGTRGFASASGVAVNWVASFVVTAAFEPISLFLGNTIMFFFFSAFSFLAYLFTSRYIPDTIR